MRFASPAGERMQEASSRVADPIIVAIDRTERSEIERLADLLAGRVGTIKIGLASFIAGGHDVVSGLRGRGFDIFLDLKLHDIPHQVAEACKAVTAMGVGMFTVHTSGGITMLEAAAQATRAAAAEAGVERPKVLGVTVLTSLDQTALKDIGVERKVTDQVRVLGGLARDAGLDGVVCAPTEVREVRRYVDEGFLVVTPGIRTPDDGLGDQRRVSGPREALADGASYLVIGRPITAADDPVAALEAIRERMRR